jgi:Uma2 family endonuclease
MTITELTHLYSFEQYLNYHDNRDRRYELVRGELVTMTPPTIRHILLTKFVEQVLDAEIRRLKLHLVCLKDAGVQTEVDFARLPDVCVVTIEQVSQLMDGPAVFQTPVLLAVEVVSPTSIKRDYEEKFLEYANKGIPEYWIIDAIDNQVTICSLIGGRYESAVLRNSQQIVSTTFPELKLTVEQVLNRV